MLLTTAYIRIAGCVGTGIFDRYIVVGGRTLGMPIPSSLYGDSHPPYPHSKYCCQWLKKLAVAVVKIESMVLQYLQPAHRRTCRI
jgi:hypothetical protein